MFKTIFYRNYLVVPNFKILSPFFLQMPLVEFKRVTNVMSIFWLSGILSNKTMCLILIEIIHFEKEQPL